MALTLSERIAAIRARLSAIGDGPWKPLPAVEFIVAAKSDLAFLLEQVEAMQWRPIESAPRDGTPILTFKYGKGGRHIFAVHTWKDGRFQATTYIPFPEMWMPLPSPPGGKE